jgi:hypothetical protein
LSCVREPQTRPRLWLASHPLLRVHSLPIGCSVCIVWVWHVPLSFLLCFVDVLSVVTFFILVTFFFIISQFKCIVVYSIVD